jgi:putative transposase
MEAAPADAKSYEILLERREVIHQPRLLSDNGSSYISADLAKWLNGQHGARPRRALSSDDPRQDRALASDAQEPLPPRELLPAGLSRNQIEAFVADYNHLRYHKSIANLTPADV